MTEKPLWSLAPYEQLLLKGRDVGQIKAGLRSTLSLPNEVYLILSCEKTKTLKDKATSPGTICFILQLLQAVYCSTATCTCIVLSISCIQVQVTIVPEMCSVGIPSFEAVGQSTLNIILILYLAGQDSDTYSSPLADSYFCPKSCAVLLGLKPIHVARELNASVAVPVLHFSAGVPSPPFLRRLLWEGNNGENPQTA